MSVLVTCAPGCTFAIAPHPSGLPGLRPLVVIGGQRARVSEQRARELWNARKIMHPVTGAQPPIFVPERSDVRIEGAAANPAMMWDGIGAPPKPEVSPKLEPSETDRTDPSRVARRRVAVAPGFPRALVDVTFDRVMGDPVEINQQAAELPWPI